MTNKEDQKTELDTKEEKLEKRRKALKSILAGSGTVVTAAAMQDKWARPVIESVVLPAHAQTSALAASFAVGGIILAPEQNQLLDMLVPTAKAVLIPTKDICMNVTGSTAKVQVTVSNSGTVYTGTFTLPFVLRDLSPQDSSAVQISGTLSADGNSIDGTVVSGGNSPSSYSAPKSSASCQLTVSTTSPPTTSPPTTSPPTTSLPGGEALL